MFYYATFTLSDMVIQGIGQSKEDSHNDACRWTDDRDLVTMPCTYGLYLAVENYGGDVMYYIDKFGVAQFNGVRT